MKTIMLPFIFFLGFLTLEVHAQTQIEMNEQAYNVFMKADKELNAVYKQVMSVLSEAEKATLKSAQKKWIKMKEASCEKESREYEGGSMAPMIFHNCLEEKTKKRTKELRAMLKGR